MYGAAIERHERLPCGPRPCPRSGGKPFESPTRWPACVRSRDAGRCGSDEGPVRRPLARRRRHDTTLTLDEQLERKLAALRKYRGTIHFFETHRSLLSSSAHQREREQSHADIRRAARPPALEDGRGPAGEGRMHATHAGCLAPAEEGDLRRLRGRLPARRSPSPGASPTSGRRHRTASTSASSRWARTSASSSATADRARAGRRRASLLRPAPVATGARGAAAGPPPEREVLAQSAARPRRAWVSLERCFW